MFQVMLIILYLSAAAINVLLIRRYVAMIPTKPLRYITAGIMVVFDILPLFSAAYMRIASEPMSHDTMALVMWTLTIYFGSILLRLAFGFFALTIRKHSLGLLLGTFAAAIVACIYINGVVNTRTDLRIKEVPLHYKSLPESFSNYRITLISDIHVGTMISPEKECQRVAEAIASTNPDLVLFAGDLVFLHSKEITPKIEKALSEIRGRDGVVAIIGNHDSGIYLKDTITYPRSNTIAEIVGSMQRANWTVLRDSTIYIRRGADSIAITGLDYGNALLGVRHNSQLPDNYTLDSLYAPIPSEVFSITISHLPQLWQYIKEVSHSSLTVAGHVHATQAKLSLGGLELSPAMLVYPQWSGLYSDGNRDLYITDGIGYVGFYFRIGANPEITLFTLNRE